MTRKKVKLVWIVSDSARKASLKKRRVGLLKKVSELTTLCGVNAFIIIYSPEDKEPAMWPSRPVVQQLLARFHSLPEMERCKKMMNQETYLKERVTKVQDQLKKHHRKNKETDVSIIMRQIYHGKTLDDCNVSELHGLIWFVEEKKKDIRKRIEYYQQVNPLPPETSLPPPNQPSAPMDATAQIGGNTSGDVRTATEPAQWDQWFIDMMNNSLNTAGSSSSRAKVDAGLTAHQAFAASSSAANQMGFPHSTLRAYNISGSDMGLQHGNMHIGSSSHGGGSDISMGLPDINVGGNINSSNEINLGLPQGNAAAGSTVASSDMGLSSEFFGGSIAGSDVGLPYDVTKPWPHNFYP
ncbi:agamous-like MADS-box protein AGL80 [Melia azedarach]|uniref:Agamous-like MADS-box protein AGL80 n=1 Tax=Melia azedarach TaxID=155640 RepID=A0ACC1X1U0_MELAZ|nr:agamous-like MADS-box protein AGL80 [Melia azedarach]